MANRYLQTVQCGINQGDAIIDDVGAGKVRLGNNSFVPEVNTGATELADAETDLTGYPAGGYAVGAMIGPDRAADGNGVVITTPLIHAPYVSDGPTTIGFAWLQNAGGEIVQLLIFDPPVTLGAVPDALRFVIEVPYGQNS